LITNTGKDILAKYLVGQAQAYASYIAIGVGGRPRAFGQSNLDFSTQESLEFEALRSPITSRGLVYDDQGKPNIVFVAELPSEQRYGITEIGVYPGQANPSAGSLGSRGIYSFAESENWELHAEQSTLTIPKIVAPLNLDQPSTQIAVGEKVFRVNANNTLFSSPQRVALFESPRFLDTAMMLRGDTSFLRVNTVTNRLEVNPDAPTYGGEHIHYNNTSLRLDSNSTEDELRLKFSVMSKDSVQAQTISSVLILIEFVNADVAEPNNFAKMEVIVRSTDPGVNFGQNRSFVIKKKLSDLVRSPNFGWSGVSSARIYATVLQSGSSAPSENFYVCLDGLRFENTTIKNPLYGLTGYSIIKTLDGTPITKDSNTSSAVEFRFGLDVL
jgi:hypothetical protein